MIELCYFSDEMGTINSYEQLQIGHEAGATGIEARSKLMGHDINDLTDAAAEVLKLYMKDFGMRVSIVGSGVGKCDMNDPDEVALNHRRFERMCELAKIFDTKIIRVFAFWNPLWQAERKLEWNTAAVLPKLREVFGPVLAHARKQGVTLALEPEADTNAGTCKSVREIIDGLDAHDVLGVAWDVNNTTKAPKEHPLKEGYQHIKGLVRHMHVKPDSKGTLETAADTDATWRQIFETVTADGFSGAATVEHWGSPEGMVSGIRQTHALLSDMGLLKK